MIDTPVLAYNSLNLKFWTLNLVMLSIVVFSSHVPVVFFGLAGIILEKLISNLEFFHNFIIHNEPPNLKNLV